MHVALFSLFAPCGQRGSMRQRLWTGWMTGRVVLLCCGQLLCCGRWTNLGNSCCIILLTCSESKLVTERMWSDGPTRPDSSDAPPPMTRSETRTGLTPIVHASRNLAQFSGGSQYTNPRHTYTATRTIGIYIYILRPHQSAMAFPVGSPVGCMRFVFCAGAMLDKCIL